MAFLISFIHCNRGDVGLCQLTLGETWRKRNSTDRVHRFPTHPACVTLIASLRGLLAPYFRILAGATVFPDSFGLLQFSPFRPLERFFRLSGLVLDLTGFDEPALCLIVLATRSLVSLAFVARAAGTDVFGFVVHVIALLFHLRTS